MRRRDRERGREFALKVIDEAPYGVLGLTEQDGTAYTVPLSLVRDGDCLYFHGASSGKKAELITDGMTVSLSFVSYCRVPELYTREEAEALLEAGGFRSLASKVYTTEFSSAHVRGVIERVENAEEKAHALQCICEKYTPGLSDLAPEVIAHSAGYTAVYRIRITEITGKQKAFDASGIEIRNVLPTEQEA